MFMKKYRLAVEAGSVQNALRIIGSHHFIKPNMKFDAKKLAADGIFEISFTALPKQAAEILKELTKEGVNCMISN